MGTPWAVATPCLALLGLGKRARVLCSDPLPRRYQYLAQGFPPDFFPAVCRCGGCGGRQPSWAAFPPLATGWTCASTHHPPTPLYAKACCWKGIRRRPVKSSSCCWGDGGGNHSGYCGLSVHRHGHRHWLLPVQQHHRPHPSHRGPADGASGADAGYQQGWLFETKTKASMELKRLAEGTLEYTFTLTTAALLSPSPRRCCKSPARWRRTWKGFPPFPAGWRGCGRRRIPGTAGRHLAALLRTGEPIGC